MIIIILIIIKKIVIIVGRSRDLGTKRYGFGSAWSCIVVMSIPHCGST